MRHRAHIIHTVLTLDPGGTERLVIELARGLAGEFSPIVCCLDRAGAWAPELQAHGIEVIELGRRPGFRPAVGWQLSQVAARSGTTILHCHHYSPFVYGALAMACRPRLRVVYTEHGRVSDAPPTTKRKLVNPCLGLVPDRMYAVSHDLRRHMIAEGLPAHRIGVIHNGVMPGAVPSPDARGRARERLGLDGDTFVIGTVARLDPVKDLLTLIRAFELVASPVPGAQLVIIGDGDERFTLAHAAREAGLGSRVVFAGHRSDARELLPAFDVFVNSSVSEGVSLTILEAMAAALPVVATRVGGTPEVVVEDSGVLVPPRAPVALANALLHLAQSPERRRALGAAGRGRVERAFTLERMVKDYGSVYTSLSVPGTC